VLGLGAALLAAQGALGAFFRYGVEFNRLLPWRGHELYQHGHGMSAYDVVYRLLAQNLLTVALAALGIFRFLRHRWASPRRLEALALVVPTLWMGCGVFLQPLPFSQTYLTFLPLLCIFAGKALADLAEASGPAGARVLGVAGLVLVLPCLGLTWDGLSGLHRPWIGLALVGLAAVAALAGWQRLQGLALVLAVIAWPLDCDGTILQMQMRGGLPRFTPNASIRNDRQLQLLGEVMVRTEPTDRILDGTSGLGTFREDAYFYWWLNHSIRSMMTPDERTTDFLDAVRRRPPKIFVNDGNTRSLSPEIRALALELGATEIRD
jgi:hypothetical protein